MQKHIVEALKTTLFRVGLILFLAAFRQYSGPQEGPAASQNPK